MTAVGVIRDALDQMDWGAAVDGDHTRGAAAILAALRGAGFAVVPREATDAMAHAAIDRNAWSDCDTIYHGVYRAMVAAAEPRTGGE